MSTITDLFNRLRDRRQETRDAHLTEIHRAIIILAENGAGKNGDLDLDYYASLIESEGLTEDDLRTNIDVYQQRVRWAELAPRVDALNKASVDALQVYNDHDLKLGRLIRDERKKLVQEERAAQRAQTQSEKALAAQGNLIADAEVTAEERALGAKQSELNAEIGKLIDATNPRLSSVDRMGRALNVGSDWASIQQFPALLAEQTRHALADETVGYSKDRRAELKSQLAAAERAVAESEKKLTRLTKQAVEINKKQVKLNDAKLLPESFRLVRATPTRLDRQKRHAREMGFHADLEIPKSIE